MNVLIFLVRWSWERRWISDGGGDEIQVGCGIEDEIEVKDKIKVKSRMRSRLWVM